MWKFTLLTSLILALGISSVLAQTGSQIAPGVQEKVVQQMILDGQVTRACVEEAGGFTKVVSVLPVDLNGDGNPEMIIYGHNCACVGARRCQQWIYVNTKSGYKLVFGPGQVDEITPQKTVTNGYKDLLVGFVSGNDGWQVIYKFDGIRYQEQNKMLSGLGQKSKTRVNKQSQSLGVIPKFITALQNQNYKTVIDLTYQFQAEVEAIKKRNPKVLWERLIQDYYNKKVSDFEMNPGFWQDYFETVAGSGGDPTKQIRGALIYLPSSCKWKITETRTQTTRSVWDGKVYTRTTTYVSVVYPNYNDSPEVENRLLKETILEFTEDVPSKLILGISRVANADIQWPIPQLTEEYAIQSFANALSEKEKEPYLVLNRFIFSNAIRSSRLREQYSKLYKDKDNTWIIPGLQFTKNIEALKEILTKHGFKIYPETFSRPGLYDSYSFALVDLPITWKSFSLSSETDFRIFEKLSFSLNSLKQKEESATAIIIMNHEGCTPICQFLRESWKNGVGYAFYIQQEGYNGKPFRDFQGKHDDAGYLNEDLQNSQESREVSFYWKPQKGWYITGIKH
ncbi:MAG: hypothetical protein HY774_19485 [Acidobacteria bacterium]|nr:hypothetical protein [Acidobacteriota bacterium]